MATTLDQGEYTGLIDSMPASRDGVRGPDAGSDACALDAALAAGDADRQRLAQIERGFGRPYNREASIRFVAARMVDTARAYLDAGMELLRISEHEPAAEFVLIRQSLGIGERTAQRMMRVALKYQGRLAELGDRLNATKLLDLAAEPDEELAGLLEGGTLAGRRLDELEQMTGPELRQVLRHEREQRRQDNETAERMLLSKDAKINDLAARLDASDGAPEWPLVMGRLTAEITTAGGSMLQQMDKIAYLREQIALLPQSDWPEQDIRAAGALGLSLLDTAETIYADFARLIDDLREVFGGLAIDRAETAANAPPPIDADTTPTRLQ